MLVIEAGAGLGKTCLLDAACERARAVGMTVLRARASELEREAPFSVARQALGPLADDGEQLGGAAELAVGLLAGLDATAVVAGPAHSDLAPALVYGLFLLVANRAERRPVLLALDDVHWSDAQSLRFVLSLIARIDELSIAVLLTLRPSEAGDSGAALIARIVAESLTELLSPQPLSEQAVAGLVGSELGDEVPPEFYSAVHAATAGNPFFVGELLREVGREGIAPDPEGAVRVRDLVPSKVARAVIVHLGRLAPQAPPLAKAAAVLGDRAQPHHVRALADLSHREATEAGDAMIRAGLAVEEHGLSFSHPIVRASVLEDMGVFERAAAHRRAAELLRDDGGDPTIVAAHLLEAAPAGDAGTVESLREASRLAIERGAPDTAAVYLRRAQEEPPAEELRPQVALELGTAELFAGEPEAVQSLGFALREARDPLARGHAALGLARSVFLAGETERAVEFTQLAVEEFQPVDEQLALITKAERNNACLLQVSTAALAHVEAEALNAEAERLGPPGCWYAFASLASLRAIEGAPAREVARLAERGLADGKLLESVGSESPVAHLPSFALVFVDEFDAAIAAAAAALEDGRRRGSPLGFLNASCFRSHLYYRIGALREAEADARAALGMSVDLPAGLGTLIARAFLADVLLERDELDEALTAVAGFDPPPGSGGVLNHILHTRGRVLTAMGRAKEALEDVLVCGAGNDGIGAINPGTIPWRSAASEAKLALGDEPGAHDLAAEELSRARQYGRPRAVGMALLALGRTETGERRLELLSETVSVLEGSGARLEHARALVEYGASLRRANHRQAAREPLVDGLELARECGALALERFANDELRATGARPRKEVYSGVDALTASELRVAKLAADGQSNPEIAQALFVTRKTIETHLSSVYTKLAIGSRRELAGALEG